MKEIHVTSYKLQVDTIETEQTNKRTNEQQSIYLNTKVNQTIHKIKLTFIEIRFRLLSEMAIHLRKENR